jgi:hypothetical protein
MNEEFDIMNTGSVPTFDGDHQKFQPWWRKFKTCAYLGGIGKVSNIEKYPNLPDLCTTPLYLETKTGQPKKMAKKQNKAAMMCLKS